MIYDILLLHFKLCRGEGDRRFGIGSLLPFACLLSSAPKKESKKGWTAGRPWVDVLLPVRSIEGRFPNVYMVSILNWTQNTYNWSQNPPNQPQTHRAAGAVPPPSPPVAERHVLRR